MSNLIQLAAEFDRCVCEIGTISGEGPAAVRAGGLTFTAWCYRGKLCIGDLARLCGEIDNAASPLNDKDRRLLKQLKRIAVHIRSGIPQMNAFYETGDNGRWIAGVGEILKAEKYAKSFVAILKE